MRRYGCLNMLVARWRPIAPSPYDPITLDPQHAVLAEERADFEAEAGVGRRRDADVGDGEVSDEGLGMGCEEPSLGQGQGEGGGGAEAGPVWLAGAGIEAGGQVDGQDGGGMSVGGRDQVGCSARRWAAESEAEQPVNDQVRGGQVRGLRCRWNELQAEGLEGTRLMSCCAAQRSEMMTEPDGGPGAPGMKETRGYQAITAVAAAPGQDQYLFVARITAEQALTSPEGDRLSGQFHQLQDVDAEIGGHEAIDLRHLVRGYGRERRGTHGGKILAPVRGVVKGHAMTGETGGLRRAFDTLSAPKRRLYRCPGVTVRLPVVDTTRIG